ncbi:class E sortase [Streptomyces sp. CT34]|uniref:class E sortase n=1 Tax=Streptomyces sp. CT34 TaxID=1553907 RepID=UPI0005BB0E8A|nr:class E sortase [Streptomyces sp. CT34]
MTALRPERDGRSYDPYEPERRDTAQDPYGPGDPDGHSDAFEAAVRQLSDPLNDPLPGRPAPPPVPYEREGRAARTDEQGPGSPWFRPHHEPPSQNRPPAQNRPPPQPLPRPAARHRKPTSDVTPPPRPTPPAPRRPKSYGPERDDYGQVNGGLGGGSYAARTEPIPPPFTVAEALTAPLPTIPPLVPKPAEPGVPGPQPDEETMALRQAEGDRDAVSRETGTATVVSRETGSAPAPGGRAARRKAAQQAARRGGRHGRHGAGAAAATTAATASPKAPMTRVEARRAQRAAKESPSLIASRALGEVFITLGVLMLLFVTYQLWWTNVRAGEEAGGAANTLQQQWDKGGGEKKNLAVGERFGIMYIPKLDVKAPIAEGIDKTTVLDHGMVGHYDASSGTKTAMPWDPKGNFAVAAHRNTHGEPFRYINRLTKGDKIVVETQSAYYTYEMESVLPQTSPSNTSVISPVPPGSGFTGPGRYITLTTCTPEFTSTFRLIVWGKMVDERPRSKGKPEALAG